MPLINQESTDFVIIGAGIVGLTVALRLKEHHPKSKIIFLEKEKEIGLHASGRNSGVLHSGIYYSPESLKAKFCAEGAVLMKDFCQEHRLPINIPGKVIIPTSHQDEDTLKLLFKRGKVNGAEVEEIDNKQLKEIEPFTHSVIDKSLFVSTTAVVDPLAVLKHLQKLLISKGVKFYFNEKCKKINLTERTLELKKNKLAYMHLINTAGLYADEIAKSCGIFQNYTMLPFKGLYYELAKNSDIKIKRHIYPVPDINVPFLGVHFTKSIEGKTYVGPTAIPAFGRENYHGFKGIKINEMLKLTYHIIKQYHTNNQGFRAYAHQESARFLKPSFVKAATVLVPKVNHKDLKFSQKVGIRAQLLDILNRKLVMDFLVEQTRHETHVLNAVSPAFTSSLSFSNHVVDLIHKKVNA